MSKAWANFNLTTKILSVTILTILGVMGALALWLSGQMRNDMMELVRVRSIVIQRQIEVARAYIASQFVAKIKNAGEGKIKIAQEHSAPDTVPLPATATREMAETLAKEGIFNARVISEAPLNPANKPEPGFEEEAIKALAAGETERITVEPINGVMTFRRMTPDIIQNQACISCHTDKKMGEMVGAVSVQVPLTLPLARLDRNINMLYTAAAAAALILGSLLFIVVRRQVIKPVQHLHDVVTQLANGDYGARLNVTAQDEIGQTGRAFNSMAQQLAKSMEEQKQAVAEQQKASQLAQAQAAEVKGVTNAIGKSQAVIEFNMDGTILGANDNFLSGLGYTMAELKGQHHRMFCEPAYTNSPEYAAFWQKLNRGEFDSGVYKRLSKGGKEIWLQASYNPIVDVAGKIYKVMQFSTDVTAEKNRNAEFEGKLAAINKAQAAIEFNLEGTVLSANDNFSSVMGYTLAEIKGQNHRMFCEPAYTNTPEYSAFWAKLNRGEFDAGVYKRIGKGGREIWIQASYNPILNANGKVYKVVKYASDVTAQKKAQAEMEQLVAEAQSVLGRLAENDLTQSMAGTYQGELDKIKASINGVVHNLTQTITLVRNAVESVTTGAEEITKGNEDLSQRTSQQASALEETSASMEEMTSTVKQNADNAKQANQLAIAARDIADKGGSITSRAVSAMEEINKSSKKIADIITVIDEIAFQTNLLALNAAVEAARAGEHGRGFAVVATEVRNLAQRSATAAKEIKGLINESIQRVSDGSELVNQSGKTLDEIVNSVKRVTDIIAEIAAASQEQAQGVDQVNKAIMQMDETTQQNAALVEETTSASHSMKEQAKELMQQVSTFKVAGSDAPRATARQAVPLAPTTAKPPVKNQAKPASKPVVEPTGVGSGNGHDRRRKDDDFEEF
ncbi:hypothetical protein YTPLAS18_27450 [Nitrospira sp.]|nr:hypothetical protein YTPLAS18_27450 [Nitrospira sp.]